MAELNALLRLHPIKHCRPNRVNNFRFLQWCREEIETAHVEHFYPEFVIGAPGYRRQQAEYILPVAIDQIALTAHKG